LAVHKHNEAISNTGGERNVLLGNEQSKPLRTKAIDCSSQNVLNGRRKPLGRLVKQQNSRLPRHGHTDRQHLLFTPAQHSSRSLEPLPQYWKQGKYAIASRPKFGADHAKPKTKIFLDG
jgi:hypothetical protein